MKRHLKKLHGIPFRTLNHLILFFVCILYGILIYETIDMSEKYKSLINSTQEYISCEQNISMLNEASDYLTEQVRLYAFKMDETYAMNYFEELLTNRRRDEAVENLEASHTEDDIYNNLELAFATSEELTEQEIYSIKLITVANEYDLDSFPEILRNMELETEDLELSSEEMIAKGQSLVFDDTYQQAKTAIASYLEQALTPLLNDTLESQAASASELKAAIINDRFLLSILLVTNFISFLATLILVLRPLQHYSQKIQKHESLDIGGVREVQNFAKTFNQVQSISAANEEQLRMQAQRDSLTGILNRGAFDQATVHLQDSPNPVALLLVDVDHFKEINDTHGHIIGDRVLKKVATILYHTFRSTDQVARIGGDEFAVIMDNITREQQEIIQKKVDQINHLLDDETDELPPISLSIGVAFSSRSYSRELFKQSDLALYQVKRHGRCGCAFYEAEA